MRMIIGGTAQGKLVFAKELAMNSITSRNSQADEVVTQQDLDQCSIVDETYTRIEELYEATIINHFHLIVRRLISEDVDITEVVDQIFLRNPQVILVSTEIGYGIVPIDQFERTYREQIGRICCIIANRAQEVYRITCGIPMRIK